MTSEISHQIDKLKEKFLAAACSGGRLLECQSLLELGADLEYTNENEDSNDDTPLLLAARNGHRPIVSLLLAHGADPMKRDRDNNNVLHIVARTTADEAMASLFSPNASNMCFSTNNDGKSPIDLAVECGHIAFVEHLHRLCSTDNDGSSESCVDDSSQSSREAISLLDIGNDSDASTSVLYNDEINQSFSTSLQIIEGNTSQLQTELYQAKYALSEVMKERDSLKVELNKVQLFFIEDDSFFANKSLQELQAYERQVKNVLKRIEKAKESMEEEKLCVVCREAQKGVLLMPCRHLCLCKDCGYRVELKRCPLCREEISERISVFS